MRFFRKSAATKGCAVAFRAHQCLVRQSAHSDEVGHWFQTSRPIAISFWPPFRSEAGKRKSAGGSLSRRGQGPTRRCARDGRDLFGPDREFTKIINQLADELEITQKTDIELCRLCAILGIGGGPQVPSRLSHRTSTRSKVPGICRSRSGSLLHVFQVLRQLRGSATTLVLSWFISRNGFRATVPFLTRPPSRRDLRSPAPGQPLLAPSHPVVPAPDPQVPAPWLW